MTAGSGTNVSYDLRGQTAFVTGASSGLGARFAKVIAAAGAKVVLASRRMNRLEALAGEIRGSGGTALPVAFDIADSDSISMAMQQAEKALGLVTILVNSAGHIEGSLSTEITLEQIDALIDINLRGPFILAREMAKRLIQESRPGRIVNIASMAAFRTYRGAALYSITKAGLVRATETLAIEWAAYHINVNCIAPGAFQTEMTEVFQRQTGREYIDTFPRKRIGDPAQLDSTLLYLLSPASDMVTGTVIKVDDGQVSR